MRTSAFTFLLSISLCFAGAWAQTSDSLRVDTLADEDLQTIRFVYEEPEECLFRGVGVSFDLAGLVMLGVANYGSLEAGVRVNLGNRWFPIVEVGLGSSDHTNENTELHFKTSSPYIRLGADYNFARDLSSGNRVFGGLRLGYALMDFDIDGPDLEDAFYGGETEYSFTGLEANTAWLELVFGIEAKIWRWIHLGWNVRYKRRLSQDVPQLGRPWYVAGFGKNGGSTFGAAFDVVIDI